MLHVYPVCAAVAPYAGPGCWCAFTERQTVASVTGYVCRCSWTEPEALFAGGNSPASGPHSAVHSSLQEALRRLKQRSYTGPRCRMHVLVTGSLHLVGDALRLLRKEPT